MTTLKKPINGTFWSEAEIQKLRPCSCEDVPILAKELGRSVSSVRNMLIKQGLYIRSSSRKNVRFWTKEELEYLEDNFPTKSTKAVAKALKRSVNSVKAKAEELNIETEYESFISASSLAKMLGITGMTVVEWIHIRGLKAKAKKRGKMPYYIIEEEDFWDWAYKHKDMIVWSRVHLDEFVNAPYWAYEQQDYYSHKNHRSPLTTAEIKSMNKDHQTMSITQLSKKYNRTEYAIKHIVYKKEEKT